MLQNRKKNNVSFKILHIETDSQGNTLMLRPYCTFALDKSYIKCFSSLPVLEIVTDNFEQIGFSVDYLRSHVSVNVRLIVLKF